MVRDLEPRYYVACLSCYNSGRLNGVWIDDPDETGAVMVEHFGSDNDPDYPDARCSCGGEEFLVHDSEGFGPYELGEVSPTEAQRVAEFISEHGIPGALALNLANGDFVYARYIVDNYQSHHKSKADWAEEREEELGTNIPSYIAWHVDWEAIAEEAEANGDVIFETYDGYVYAFGTNH